MLHFSTRRPTFVAMSLMLAAASASAVDTRWSVTNLHPAGTASSYANGASRSHQVGNTGVGGASRAAIWSSTSASYVTLHFVGTRSAAYAVDDSQQAGWVRYDGDHAALWYGTAASWIDLHPITSGATSSFALGLGDGQQVGYASIGGLNRAFLWNSSAASWVNLHPDTAISSIARGTGAGHQVGYAYFGPDQYHTVAHAGIWSGTAASWIDLHPAIAESSLAFATDAGHQVGSVTIAGETHAAIWSGSESTYVDLNPTGSIRSEAVAIHGDQQVGHALINGIDRASLWSGSVASWVNLSALLPADFSNSFAQTIWSDPSRTYIAGYGFNTATNRDEALLWTWCRADFNGDGTLDLFDYLDFVDVFAGSLDGADFNADGVIDLFDYLDFVDAFSHSC